MEAQNTINRQGNTEQISNAGSITTLDFKKYYRVIAVKTTWYCHKTDLKTKG
jgi:hypothetical protein